MSWSVCVCDVFYFSGAWNFYLAGFCSNPPRSPWSVSENGGLQRQSGNHYSEKFTALSSPSRTIQSNPSTTVRTLLSTDAVQHHIPEAQSLPPTQRRQFRKKPSQKPVLCIVTLAWLLNYDPLIQSVERGTFWDAIRGAPGALNFKTHRLYQNISTISSWPKSGLHILQTQFSLAGVPLIGL